MGCLTVKTQLVAGGNLCIKIKDTEEHLHVTCFPVCSASQKAPFIEVQPSEIQWITPYSTITYNIRSNTNWNIV